MSALPTPAARRLPRSRWTDIRLIVGVLLVLLSVVVGARLFAAADDTVPVWVSTSDLGPNIPLTAEDLIARRVRLETGVEGYLGATGPPPVGRVLVRPIGKGELVPRAALATSETGAAGELRRVAVSVARATGLSRGAVVDVYRLPSTDAAAREAQPAALVLERVTVAQVEEASRALGAPASREVVLLLPSGEVRRLLDAQAGGRIELVQVPQGGGVALPPTSAAKTATAGADENDVALGPPAPLSVTDGAVGQSPAPVGRS